MMKKAQYRDDRGNWKDMSIIDFRVTPEAFAFESAKKGLQTRVIQYKPDGSFDVVKVYRQQLR